ncbi:MAG: M28 family peptidase [Planctomycetes bacterium]|nr:M28 family peptidase [Planctomycetota bacterium]
MSKLRLNLILICLLALSFVSCESNGTAPDQNAGNSTQTAISVTVQNTGAVQPAVFDANTLMDAESIKKHIDYLASPELEGRESTEPGGKKAASYIADFYKSLGLQPAGDHNSFLQEFTVDCSYSIDTLLWTLKTANNEPVIINFKKGVDFAPFNCSANALDNSYLKVIFAGYGITASEFGYDDYDGIDVSGKAVVVITGEPPSDMPNFFDGEKNTKYADDLYKIVNAQKHNAAAILIANSTDCEKNPALNSQLCAWPDALPAKQQEKFIDPAKAEIHNETQEKVAAQIQARMPAPQEPVTIPAFLVTAKTLETLSAGECMCELVKKIDSSKTPCSKTQEDVQINMNLSTVTTKRIDQNVLAVLKGSDPALENEYIIIGAHYDHLGMNSKGDIFYGANDNASGTAALLEIAKALSATKPGRSILFASFGAEEQGITGSTFFCDHPTVPRENIIAMLNMDMLGRGEPDKIWLIGVLRNPELADIVKKLNAETGVNLNLQDNIEFAFPYGSDFWPFHVKKIPVMNFTSSRFTEYHTAGDTADKIDHQKTLKSARLVLAVANQLANSDVKFPEPKNVDVPYPSHGKGK